MYCFRYACILFCIIIGYKGNNIKLRRLYEYPRDTVIDLEAESEGTTTEDESVYTSDLEFINDDSTTVADDDTEDEL